MAKADYMQCAVCSSKVHYDADVDYQPGTEVGALCAECAETRTLTVTWKDDDGNDTE